MAFGYTQGDERPMTFKAFYSRFPRRVKPFNAERAYDKAMLVATHEEVMEGLERFIQAEPWHDDLKYCPHPASWLNSGEWLNEYEAPKADYGFFMAGGEKAHLCALLANGVWKPEWGEKPQIKAAKARLDELNGMPTEALRLVSND